MNGEIAYLQIEPTTRCNFVCGFCSGRHMAQRDLPLALYREVLDRYPAVRYIQLQGEGEPMMHSRFLDMIEMARGRGIRVSFITNGSFLTAELSQALVELGVDWVSISLESPDERVFQEIRGGKLSKVLAGVRRLLDARRRVDSVRPAIGFSVSVLRQTRQELPRIIQLYRELGLDGGIQVQPLQHMEAYAQHYDADMQAQMLSSDELRAFITEYKPYASQLLASNHQPGMEQMFMGWKSDQGTCPWVEAGAFITTEGLEMPCCRVKAPEYAYGHARDSSDSRARARSQLRAFIAAGDIPAGCSGCGIARRIAKHAGKVAARRKLPIVG